MPVEQSGRRIVVVQVDSQSGAGAGEWIGVPPEARGGVTHVLLVFNQTIDATTSLNAVIEGTLSSSATIADGGATTASVPPPPDGPPILSGSLGAVFGSAFRLASMNGGAVISDSNSSETISGTFFYAEAFSHISAWEMIRVVSSNFTNIDNLRVAFVFETT